MHPNNPQPQPQKLNPLFPDAGMAYWRALQHSHGAGVLKPLDPGGCRQRDQLSNHLITDAALNPMPQTLSIADEIALASADDARREAAANDYDSSEEPSPASLWADAMTEESPPKKEPQHPAQNAI